MNKTSPPQSATPSLQDMLLTMTHDFKFLRSSRMLETYWDRRQRKDYEFYDIAELYHENTKLQRHAIAHVAVSTDVFMKQGPIMEAATQVYKEYANRPQIKLPKEDLDLPCRLDDAIKNRRSVRHYTGQAMELAELSKLLLYTNGITNHYHFTIDSGKELLQYQRAAPSGGALYPTEIYIAALNVTGVPAGIYHYNVLSHSLEALQESKDLVERFPSAFPVHPDVVRVDQASAVFVLTSMFERTMSKYGPRGYRYALQEAGHIAQNVYLVSTAMGKGAVALAGFYDDELNRWLDIDGVDEAAVYATVIGHPF